MLPPMPPHAHIHSMVCKPFYQGWSLAIRLADKSHIEDLTAGVRTVNFGIRSFLAIDWLRSDAPIIVKPEFLGDKTEIVFRRDLANQMKLIRSVTKPVGCHNAERTYLADYARLDTSIIEIAEKKIDRFLRLGLSHLREQRVAQPGAISVDKFALDGIGRIELLESAIQIVFEIDDLVSQFNKRSAQILTPKIRPELAVG